MGDALLRPAIELLGGRARGCGWPGLAAAGAAGVYAMRWLGAGAALQGRAWLAELGEMQWQGAGLGRPHENRSSSRPCAGGGCGRGRAARVGQGGSRQPAEAGRGGAWDRAEVGRRVRCWGGRSGLPRLCVERKGTAGMNNTKNSSCS
jgi:hypothetical protein